MARKDTTREITGCIERVVRALNQSELTLCEKFVVLKAAKDIVESKYVQDAVMPGAAGSKTITSTGNQGPWVYPDGSQEAQ